MNGKKFVIGFLALAALTAAGLCFGIKRGYETRPDIKITEPAK